MGALNTYILQVRRLLHDATGQFYTDSDLTDYINEARSVVAMDSGCVRQLNVLSISPQRETYALNGTLLQCVMTNNGTGYTTLPTVNFSGGTGTGAAAQAGLGVVSAAVNAAGLGYTAGSVLGPAAGTISPYVISRPGNIAPGSASFVVATVNGTGGVTGITTSQVGNYSVIPGTVAVATTGGGGSGCTLNLTWGVSAVNITNAGGDIGNGQILYTSAPAVAFAGGGGASAAATASISNSVLDVLNISVIWNSLRVALDFQPFSVFQARMRAYSLNYQVPGAFTILGVSTAGVIYLFPVPNSVYPCEVDSKILPNPLVTDSTVEQIVYPFSDSVCYQAAYKAKFQEQAFDEAERFRIRYVQRMGEALATSYERRLPSMFTGRMRGGSSGLVR